MSKPGIPVDPYMHALHFAFALGAFLSPNVFAISPHLPGTRFIGPVKLTFYLLGATFIPTAIALLLIPCPSHRPQLHPPREGHAWWASLMTAFTFRVVVVTVATGLFLGLYVGTEVTFGGFIFTFALQTELLKSAPAAAALTGTYWGFLSAGRLLAVPLALRIPALACILCNLLVCGVAIGALCLLQTSLIALWLASAAFGLGMGPLFPAAINLAEAYVDVGGLLATCFVVCASAGEMMLPWLADTLSGEYGFQWILYVCAAGIAAALGVELCLLLVAGVPSKHTAAPPATAYVELQDESEEGL